MTQTQTLAYETADDLAFWQDQWNRQKQTSIFRQTQLEHPGDWQVFYDRVSGLWGPMTGSSARLGKETARFVVDNGLAFPGNSALDLGCGPGDFSLALAQKGLEVTAVDNSGGMIQTLKEKIKAHHGARITPLEKDWQSLPLNPEYDMVAACFFPEALCPEGIWRMEWLAKNRCLLVLGDGREAFGLRKALWEKVMGNSHPATHTHLTCAVNYLKASGREPRVAKRALPALLDMELKEATDYFQAYFTIFGKIGPMVKDAIIQTLSPYCSQGRLQRKGMVHLAMVWWTPPITRRQHY